MRVLLLCSLLILCYQPIVVAQKLYQQCYSPYCGSLPGLDYINGVKITNSDNDNGHVLLGSNSLDDIFIVKNDSIGDSLWTRFWHKSYNSFYTGSSDTIINVILHPYDIISHQNSGYLFSAIYDSSYWIYNAGVPVYQFNQALPVLTKTDSYGHTLWSMFFDMGVNYSPVICRSVNAQNSIFVYSHDEPQGKKIKLMELDGAGNIIWQKEITGFTNGHLVKAASYNSNIFLVNTNDTISNLYCLDNFGNFIWSKSFAYLDPSKILDIGFRNQNIYLLLNYPHNNTKINLLKCDLLGTVLKSISIGDSNLFASKIITNNINTYIGIIYNLQSSPSSINIWNGLCKLDTNENLVSLKKVSVGSFTGGTNPSFLSGSTDLISNASGIVSLENASVYLHYGPSPGTKYFPIIYQLDSSGNYCTPTDTVAIQIQPATLSSVAISTTFVSSFISQFPSALIEGDSILYIEKYCTGITGNPEFISNDNYSEFNITPNPSSGLFTINIKGTKQPYTINVFDVMGKKIWTGKGNSTQQVINLSEAGKGIYFVKLHGEQLNKTQKVVVQ